MIYKYVAASERTAKKKGKVNSPGDAEKHATIIQPGLFRTCSQIYTESRGLFYRHHVFKLHLRREHIGLWDYLAAWICLQQPRNRVARWLDAIGKEARRQIRTLEIQVHYTEGEEIKTYARFMGDIHKRLPDEATVVYRCASSKYAAETLFELGKIFYDRDPGPIPHFEHRLVATEWSHGNLWATMSNTPHWLRYQLLRLPVRNRGSRPSLTFGPGLGWFGGGS